MAVVLAVLRVHVAVPELVLTDNGLPTSLRGVLLKPPGWVVGFVGCFSPPFGTYLGVPDHESTCIYVVTNTVPQPH